MEGVLAYVTLFAGNFAPRNWAFCAGQILPIAQNTALFSLLGTVYGGNGQTTFALPDLRGRAVVGKGQGPGLSQYDLGQVSGEEITTLTPVQMAAHAHTVSVTISPAAATNASAASPVNGVYATSTEQLYNSTADSSMQPYQAALTVAPAGASSLPFSIVNPLLALNYLICMQGIFPARN
jgi:microcystin-dependent protein